MTKTTAYVIDASYLCELFAIPGCSHSNSVTEIRKRFKQAAQDGARLYVTLPAIYEVAGHIAGVSQGRIRKKLSQKLRETVVGSIDEALPWNLLPKLDNEAVRQLLDAFVEHSPESLSLVDVTLVGEAQRLRQETYRGPDCQVHIWTKDNGIKAREPDKESNAFMG